jgi:hypothetical protein
MTPVDTHRVLNSTKTMIVGTLSVTTYVEACSMCAVVAQVCKHSLANIVCVLCKKARVGIDSPTVRP